MGTELVAFLTAAIGLVGTFIVMILKINAVRKQLGKVEKDVGEVHIILNSRLTELLELTRTSARAEGVKEGQETTVIRMDMGE